MMDKSIPIICTLLSWNKAGILPLDYICTRKIQTNTIPDNPCIVKTIVTTDVAEQIANDYGIETINVLTGFKYIGEQIGKLEREGNARKKGDNHGVKEINPNC